jgi:predicted lipid carrier protein YhbT
MNPNFTIPKFRLPAFVASLGQKLPQWPHALVLVAGMNAAMKLNLLPADSLELLEGKLFRVRIIDTGGEASYTYRDGMFRPVFRPDREPDLAFSAHLSAYLQLLARQEDPDTLFFNRELEITGDTELGLVVKNMLDAVEWPSLPRLPLPSR